MSAVAADTEAPAVAPTDLRVLRMLADGLTLLQVGRRLGLSRSAIQMRMLRLRERLGATTNVHAVVIAIRDGLINLDTAKEPK